MQHITSRKKLLFYGLGGFGINMLGLIVTSYLINAVLTKGFATNVENWTYLNKNLVYAGIWSAMILISKIVDGVIDIPMASFTDNLKSKWGRRRPAMLIGLVSTILFFILFMIPLTNSQSVLNTIWLGLMLCLFYSAYTLTLDAYYATFSEIVDNEKDRIFLSNVKTTFDVIYFSLGYALLPVLANFMNIRLVGLLFVPFALTMLIPIFMVKERSTLDKDITEDVEKEVHVGVISSLIYALKNKDFVKWMLVFMCMNAGLQLFLSALNVFFSGTFYFNGLGMMFVMATSFAPTPLFLILYNKILKKKGFVFAFRYALGAFVICMLLVVSAFFIKVPVYEIVHVGDNIEYGAFVNNYSLFDRIADSSLYNAINGENPTLMGQINYLPIILIAIGSALFASIAIGSFFSVNYMIPSQLADDEKKRTGVSNPAMYFAVQGLAGGLSSGIAIGLLWNNLRDNNLSYTMPVFVILFCIIAIAVSFILPKSLSNLGKNSISKTKVVEEVENIQA
jgi:Na+/melibiose symporter-like transporter